MAPVWNNHAPTPPTPDQRQKSLQVELTILFSTEPTTSRSGAEQSGAGDRAGREPALAHAAVTPELLQLPLAGNGEPALVRAAATLEPLQELLEQSTVSHNVAHVMKNMFKLNNLMFPRYAMHPMK
ncbi:hypothetical protein UY3_06307 [Chelonia mydas]|uniref:Uncharacterized protein n=1 Tax=Chelonia mydas TaxID=8469 RepID=M7BH18_CHEMY|nr:hypothetical protein UY3_06307 [Chelonia mydas]